MAKKISKGTLEPTTSVVQAETSDISKWHWGDQAGLTMWESRLQGREEEAWDCLEDVLSSLPSTFRLPMRLLQPTQPTVDAAGTEENGPRQDHTALHKEQWQRAYAWLRQVLAQSITRLIDRDMNQLLQILYRIDVAESRVQSAFQAPFRDIPELLAELVIARQLEKILLQRDYAATAKKE